MAKVFLGIPTYNGQVREELPGVILMASLSGLIDKLRVQGLSATTYNFNQLYAKALNSRKDGITHFCMLHADITPENSFVDKLLELMEKHEADVMSAIVPIKDSRGLTSTALYESVKGSDPNFRPRRLTMHEVYNNYPPTFTDEKLLVNTGCMLVDIRKPWAEKVCFKFFDNIIERNGTFVPVFTPEDWLFSKEARALGAKLFATREVKVTHYGNGHFSNTSAWGSLKVDGEFVLPESL